MSCNNTLPIPEGLLKDMMDNILENSYVKQESFALSASLATLATIVGRTMQFQGIAPNLYVLNVAPSGSGKDAPQKKVKEFLVDANATKFIGTGSYTSDSGITDRLQLKPSVLDIVDEAGEELLKLNTSKTEYGSKMAAILAELYTSSTSTFLGRALKDGNVGRVDRPNLNILASTTPTGFAQGVNRASIEKGLLGRFFVFIGEYSSNAQRIKKHTRGGAKILNTIRHWANFKPPESSEEIGSVTQSYLNVESTEEAEDALNKVFNHLDDIRVNTNANDILLPVIARLYQQMLKITLLHAVSRAYDNIPIVDAQDVEFAYHLVMFAFSNYSKLLDENFSENYQEKLVKQVYKIITDHGKLFFSDLVRLTKGLNKNQRNGIIDTLEEAKLIIRDIDRSRNEQYFIAIKE